MMEKEQQQLAITESLVTSKIYVSINFGGI